MAEQTRNDTGNRFCKACGTPAEDGRLCKHCGAALRLPADEGLADDQGAAARRTFAERDDSQGTGQPGQ
ncbi:hypothetical protein [Streptomyces sp. NBC_00083]|uniref:hypothetical protein n=1 Tax=Streptomyces sp. NBC_00083 TaxID=2975647 RepID=UPI002255CA49|nr:hypothetical protein [Streptomyces sp. NBC_00083]MCX5386860.1 hypothetical protein [Streptomyces sp. NBC_00083]